MPHIGHPELFSFAPDQEISSNGRLLRVMPDDSAEHIHVSMSPLLAPVLFKHLGQESSICVLTHPDSRQPDSKAPLLLERLQPIQRVRMVLANEFKSILECHDNGGMQPLFRCPSQRTDEFFV
jgi:hypothetical protein